MAQQFDQPQNRVATLAKLKSQTFDIVV
ncbi:MAG: hypothetical protein RLZZ534_171, partial [Actinomycetota bacterium]